MLPALRRPRRVRRRTRMRPTGRPGRALPTPTGRAPRARPTAAERPGSARRHAPGTRRTAGTDRAWTRPRRRAGLPVPPITAPTPRRRAARPGTAAGLTHAWNVGAVATPPGAAAPSPRHPAAPGAPRRRRTVRSASRRRARRPVGGARPPHSGCGGALDDLLAGVQPSTWRRRLPTGAPARTRPARPTAASSRRPRAVRAPAGPAWRPSSGGRQSPVASGRRPRVSSRDCLAAPGERRPRRALRRGGHGRVEPVVLATLAARSVRTTSACTGSVDAASRARPSSTSAAVVATGVGMPCTAEQIAARPRPGACRSSARSRLPGSAVGLGEEREDPSPGVVGHHQRGAAAAGRGSRAGRRRRAAAPDRRPATRSASRRARRRARSRRTPSMPLAPRLASTRTSARRGPYHSRSRTGIEDDATTASPAPAARSSARAVAGSVAAGSSPSARSSAASAAPSAARHASSHAAGAGCGAPSGAGGLAGRRRAPSPAGISPSRRAATPTSRNSPTRRSGSRTRPVGLDEHVVPVDPGQPLVEDLRRRGFAHPDHDLWRQRTGHRGLTQEAVGAGHDVAVPARRTRSEAPPGSASPAGRQRLQRRGIADAPPGDEHAPPRRPPPCQLGDQVRRERPRHPRPAVPRRAVGPPGRERAGPAHQGLPELEVELHRSRTGAEGLEHDPARQGAPVSGAARIRRAGVGEEPHGLP